MAKRSIIPVFVPHLGCPNDCVFCNQHHISGSAEPATAESARITIENAIAAGAQNAEIAFYGGSFTAIPKTEQEALLAVASEYVSKGKAGSIRLSTRPDCIDEERLDMLKKFGVSTVELGVQSLDEHVLKLSRRGHTAQDAFNAAKLVKQYGFTLILQMMTGLPGDTFEKTEQTAKKIISMRPNGVRIYPTVVVKDTELFYMWQRGEYQPHSVETAAVWCARLLELFDEAGIPVIRLGLNPTDDLSEGEAAAGAYHPAMGELAISALYFKKACEQFDALKEKNMLSSQAVLRVAKGKTSQMIGQHQSNKKELMRKYSLRSLTVIESNGNLPKYPEIFLATEVKNEKESF